MKKILVTATAAFVALATLAGAEDAPFTSQIKARQGLMELNALNIGVLAGMAKGETPYDAEKAKAAADALVGVYNLDLPMLWPQGSDNSANPATHALPAIWADGSDIGAKVENWEKAALAMQAAAGKDLDSLKGAMNDLGGACGACHKAFRASMQ
ncbi:MAG: cytochrome c [Paracoccaceae bacterium]